MKTFKQFSHSLNESTLSNRINTAIDNIKNIDPDYWNSTLQQRMPNGAGSTVIKVSSPEDLEHKLRHAQWEQYDHPECAEGCTLFKTKDIQGHFGIKNLDSFPNDTLFTVDDRKNTGKASLTAAGLKGDKVGFTSIILGPEDDKEIVYTFHPGHPVSPSIVDTEGLHGKQLTKSQALNLGFKNVKLI